MLFISENSLVLGLSGASRAEIFQMENVRKNLKHFKRSDLGSVLDIETLIFKTVVSKSHTGVKKQA